MIKTDCGDPDTVRELIESEKFYDPSRNSSVVIGIWKYQFIIQKMVTGSPVQELPECSSTQSSTRTTKMLQYLVQYKNYQIYCSST